MFQLIQRMNLFFPDMFILWFYVKQNWYPFVRPTSKLVKNLTIWINSSSPKCEQNTAFNRYLLCHVYAHWTLLFFRKRINNLPLMKTAKKKNWISTCGISVYISYQYLDRERHWFINESTKTNVTKLEARYLFSNHSVVSPRSKFLAYGFPWKGILSIFLFGHLHMFCLVTVV